MKTIELETSVLKLPPRKRARIASRLLESLNSDNQRAHTAAWREEAEARVAAFDAGKISAKSADQVLSYKGKRKK
jgi:putative addiction module component (TIGR02574 family)